MLPSPRVGGALSGALLWSIAEAGTGVNAMKLRFRDEDEAGKKKDPNLDGVTTWVHDGLQFATRMSGHDDDSLTNPVGAGGRCCSAALAGELQERQRSSIGQSVHVAAVRRQFTGCARGVGDSRQFSSHRVELRPLGA